MLMDKLMELSDGQAITATYLPSTKQIDLGEAVPQYSAGQRIMLNVRVGDIPFSGNSVVKCKAQLQDSADDTTYNTVLESVAVSCDAAGDRILRVALPMGLRRYIQMNYSFYIADGTTPAAPTAGVVDAWIGLDTEG